jgi:hypothetical protein
MDFRFIGCMFLVLVVFASLFGLPVVLAQSSGLAEAGAVNVNPVQSRYLGQVEQKIVDISEKYVKQKLGDEYYNKYIVFKSGESYEDCTMNSCVIRNEISFDYNISFDISRDPHLGGPPRIATTLNGNKEVVRYIGPVKPYQFLVSQGMAIELAKSYGFSEITNVELSVSSNEENGYEIVWAVSSNDISGYGEVLNEPLYRGVYIGIDSGEVLGEYRINPMIQTPSNAGNIKLGEFYEEISMDSELGLTAGQKSNGFYLFLEVLTIFSLIIIFLVCYKIKKR